MNRSKLVLLIGFGLCFVVVAAFVVIIQRSVHVSFAIRTALELPRDTAWMISAARPKDAAAQLTRVLGVTGLEHIVNYTGIRWDNDAELEQIGIEPEAYIALSAVDIAHPDYVLSLGLTKQAQSLAYLRHSLVTTLGIPDAAIAETTLGRWPALWIVEQHRTWALSVQQSRCLVFFSSAEMPNNAERLRLLAEKVDKTKEKFSLADVPAFRRSVEQDRSPVMYVYASHIAVTRVIERILPEVQPASAEESALVWAIAEDPSAKLFHTFRWYGGANAPWRFWFMENRVASGLSTPLPILGADVQMHFGIPNVTDTLKTQMLGILARLGGAEIPKSNPPDIPSWIQNWTGDTFWYWAHKTEAGQPPTWWVGLRQRDDVPTGVPNTTKPHPIYQSGIVWWTNEKNWTGPIDGTVAAFGDGAQGPVVGTGDLKKLIRTYIPDTVAMTGYDNVQITSRIEADFFEWTVIAGPESSSM